MSLVRRIARPLLAAPVIAAGVDSARHPGLHVEPARPVITRVAGPLKLPDNPELVVRAAGGATAAAGVLLALGKLPRLSALVIVATAPVAQASRPFWTEKDPEAKRVERDRFLKNLGLLGGALLAAVDTDGRPGLVYRGRIARKAAKRQAELTAKEATALTGRAQKRAARAAKQARKDAKKQAKIVKLEARNAAQQAKSAAKDAVH